MGMALVLTFDLSYISVNITLVPKVFCLTKF